MKIKKSELRNILNKLKPVSLRDDVLIENFLGQLIFSEQEIAIFNDQTYMSFPIKTDLNCVVSFTKLLNFITKTTGKFVKIVEDEEKVKIICGKAKLSLNSLMLNEIDLATIEEIKESLGDDSLHELPEGFREGINACAFSASKDPSDGALACICINGSVMMSSDKTRASVWQLEHPLLKTKENILLNADLAPTLTKLEATHFRVSKAWVIFMDEDSCMLAMRRISGKYQFKTIMDLIENFQTEQTIELPKEFNRILDLVITMTSETTYLDRFVHIKLEDNELILSSSSESANIEEKIKIEYSDTLFRSILQHYRTL